MMASHGTTSGHIDCESHWSKINLSWLWASSDQMHGTMRNRYRLNPLNIHLIVSSLNPLNKHRSTWIHGSFERHPITYIGFIRATWIQSTNDEEQVIRDTRSHASLEYSRAVTWIQLQVWQNWPKILVYIIQRKLPVYLTKSVLCVCVAKLAKIEKKPQNFISLGISLPENPSATGYWVLLWEAASHESATDRKSTSIKRKI